MMLTIMKFYIHPDMVKEEKIKSSKPFECLDNFFDNLDRIVYIV